MSLIGNFHLYKNKKKKLNSDSLSQFELDRLIFHLDSSTDYGLIKYLKELISNGKLISNESTRSLFNYLKSEHRPNSEIINLDNKISQIRYQIINQNQRRKFI